uniref:Uncharacterized protein n=1 Tax=Arundo donax TaxID=35708 RepID=A0A0A9ABX0_ARUDO
MYIFTIPGYIPRKSLQMEVSSFDYMVVIFPYQGHFKPSRKNKCKLGR